MGERPLSYAPVDKFKSPQEELAYLRARVAEKERELEATGNAMEHERIAKREIVEYAATPAPVVIHEATVIPEHDLLHTALKLEPESHDTQIDQLLKIVAMHGIKNALSVVQRMKNIHLEDDLHRALVRYIAEGLPDAGSRPPEKLNKALHMVLFEVHPQAHSEGKQEHEASQKLEQVLASSEQLYAGLVSLVSGDEGFSLEIAVGEEIGRAHV